MPRKKKSSDKLPTASHGYCETIKELSDKLVAAQRPIRVLDAIKWGNKLKEDFFAAKFKKLPAVDHDYYQIQNPLEYDPKVKIAEFYDLEHEIRSRLGQYNLAGNIMERMCREYRGVIHLVMYRGTPDFSKISQEIYGSPTDVIYAGQPNLNDLAVMVSDALKHIKKVPHMPSDEKVYSPGEVVALLQHRLDKYFGNMCTPHIQIKLSDGIMSDAAAGAEIIRINKNHIFSDREIRELEVHEGWVHVGTTLNGLLQPYCTFLSKGCPSSTVTQEGLGVLMEIFTFSSYPRRIRKITNRIQAINKAEQGADFIEIFNFFREQGNEDEESYYSAVRTFRGSLPNGKPFTKDLSYSKGFVLIYNFIRIAISKGDPTIIPLLFTGKTTLEEIHILSELIEEKIVTPPKFLPPQFADLGALCAWMSYALFFNKLNLEKIAADYKNLL